MAFQAVIQLHICLAFSCLLRICCANDMYVAHGGHDRPQCGHNKNSPCATIRYAIAKSAGNDTIYVSAIGGAYVNETAETHLQISHTLTLKATNGTVGIRCEAHSTKLFNVTGFGNSIVSFSVYGFSITQCGSPNDLLASAIVINNATVKIFQCRFAGNGILFYHSQLDTDCPYLQLFVFNTTFNDNIISRPYQPALTLAGCQSVEVIIQNTTFKQSPLMIIGTQNVSAQFHNVTFDGFDLRGTGLEITLGDTANYIVLSNCTVMNHSHGKDSPVVIAANGNATITPNLHLKQVNFLNNQNMQTSGGALSVLARMQQEFPLYMNMAIEGCHFINNSVTDDGGAIYLENVAAIKINQCYFHENNGSTGGAVKVYQGNDIRITNTNMSDNHAFHLDSVDYLTIGGALHVYGATLHISNSRFEYNIARYGATDVYVENSPSVSIQQSYFENHFSGLAGLQTALVQIRAPRLLVPRNQAQLNNNILNGTALRDHTLLDIQCRSQLNNNNVWCRRGQNIQTSSIPAPDVQTYDHVVYWCETCPEGTCTHTNGHMVDSSIADASNTSTVCQLCPDHAVCVYGETFADPNYWGYTGDGEIHYQLCPQEYCCHDGHCRGQDACANNRMGKLCGECQKGLVAVAGSGSCVKEDDCMMSAVPYTLVTVIIFSCLYLALIVFFSKLGPWVQELVQLITDRICRRCSHTRNDNDNNEEDDELLNPNQTDTHCTPEKADDNILPAEDPEPHSSTSGEEHFSVTSPLGPFHFRSTVDASILTIFFFLQLAPLVYCFHLEEGHAASHLVMATTDLFYLRPLFTLFGSMCSFPGLGHAGIILMNFLAIASLYMMLFLSYGVLGLVILAAARCFRANAKQNMLRLTGSFASAFLYIIFLTYIPLVRVLSLSVQCLPLANETVLYTDAAITCYQPWQRVAMACLALSPAQLFLAVGIGGHTLRSHKISFIRFFFGCIFPPILWVPFIVGHIRNWCHPPEHTTVPHQTTSPATYRVISQLQGPFPQHSLDSESKSALRRLWAGVRRNWYGATLLHFLIIVLKSTLLAPLPMVRSMLLFFVCLAALVWHYYVRPYASTFLNALQGATWLVLVLLAMMGAYRSGVYSTGTHPVSSEKAVLTFCDWFYAVVVMGTVVVALACFLFMIAARFVSLATHSKRTR